MKTILGLPKQYPSQSPLIYFYLDKSFVIWAISFGVTHSHKVPEIKIHNVDFNGANAEISKLLAQVAASCQQAAASTSHRLACHVCRAKKSWAKKASSSCQPTAWKADCPPTTALMPGCLEFYYATRSPTTYTKKQWSRDTAQL